LKHSASNGNLISVKAEQARRIAANIDQAVGASAKAAALSSPPKLMDWYNDKELLELVSDAAEFEV
jgi:hypothetical protein